MKDLLWILAHHFFSSFFGVLSPPWREGFFGLSCIYFSGTISKKLVLHKISVVNLAIFAHTHTQIILNYNILSEQSGNSYALMTILLVLIIALCHSIHSHVRIQGFLLEYCTAARSAFISAIVSFNRVADQCTCYWNMKSNIKVIRMILFVASKRGPLN